MQEPPNQIEKQNSDNQNVTDPGTTKEILSQENKINVE